MGSPSWKRNFSPSDIIERLCEHHKTTAEQLLSALLKALGRYRLFGHETFPDLTPSNPSAPPDVYSEIQGYMLKADPPIDPTTRAPGSLLNAVMMCLEHDRQNNLDLAEEMMTDDNPDAHEWCQGMMLNQRAHDQRVMQLAIKECINQIEAMGLELAIEGDPG